MAATIRGGISDLVNTLNKIRNNVTDPCEQLDIQKLLKVLFILWEQVIYDSLDSTSDEYKAVIKSLGEAERQAKSALDDLKKVGAAIKSATKAAKLVDKLVKLAIKLI